MSLWEMMACIEGYKAANGQEEKPEAPSADEFYDMLERLGEPVARPTQRFVAVEEVRFFGG